MIIHISGAPGSGKTTLGNKIKKQNKNVIVKDLDDILMKFTKGKRIKDWNSKKYQEYLDKLLEKYKNSSKIIILVGLNKDMGHSNTFYNVYADYKFYIKIPIKKHLEQLFLRNFNGWTDWIKERNHKILFNQLLKDEKQVISDLTKSLSNNLSLSKLKKETQDFDKLYKTKKYIFMTSNNIYKKIKKII